MSAPTDALRRRLVVGALLLGVVVMVAFDRWFTLVAGVGLMLGAVVAGLFLIAAPGGFLDHDRDDGRGGDHDGEEPPVRRGPGPAA